VLSLPAGADRDVISHNAENAMRPVRQFAIAAIVAVVAACGNTADGVKQDTENAADKVGDVAADAGNSMAAATETADIKTAMMTDAIVSAMSIDVDTNKETKIVTLTGTVETAAQRDRAEAIAKEKAPGYAVTNNIAIKK
jgi:hyperosmotically inducible periplasmic protein